MTQNEEGGKRGGILAYLRRQDWGGFILNFLSVVLGIVLTFWGDALIKEHNEKEDVRKTMQLVYDELYDDVQELKSVDKNLQLECDAATYLRQFYGRFTERERDSMIRYCNAPLSAVTFEVSDDALELLKTSALLPKIENKELALKVIGAYHTLSSVENGINFYIEKKKQMLDDARQEQMRAVFAKPHYSAAEMWEAITSTEEGRHFLNEIIVQRKMSLDLTPYIEYVESIIDQIREQYDISPEPATDECEEE